jgi:hypothetical protein
MAAEIVAVASPDDPGLVSDTPKLQGRANPITLVDAWRLRLFSHYEQIFSSNSPLGLLELRRGDSRDDDAKNIHAQRSQNAVEETQCRAVLAGWSLLFGTESPCDARPTLPPTPARCPPFARGASRRSVPPDRDDPGASSEELRLRLLLPRRPA